MDRKFNIRTMQIWFQAKSPGVMIICFSANASILAGVALLGIGTLTVRRADRLAQMPYAAIPLIFGMQQLVEGYLWKVLPIPSQTTDIVTTIYLAFSHVLWPIFVPLAVWMIEPLKARRKLLLLPMAAGAVASIYFLFALLTEPVSALIEGKHIVYHLPHRHDAFILTLYIIGTCLTPLLSSYRTIRLFGLVITIALIVTRIAYMHWFASVWCFFAALMSAVVFLHFTSKTLRDDQTYSVKL
jgi:hypothetical protein